MQIELGKATGENLKALASGKAQFASLDLTGAMISAGAKNSTAYRDFRAVLAIHQRTLVSIMAMRGSGITTPKDLKGKRIAAAANSVNQLLFPGYAKLAGIDSAMRWGFRGPCARLQLQARAVTRPAADDRLQKK